MKKYLKSNMQAYENTADEFEEKIEIRKKGTEKLVNYFIESVKVLGKGNGGKILELGTGSGYASLLLSEKGYDVSAIEFSEKMADVAKRTAPKANIIVNEFLGHNFEGETYDLIFAVAFIHLFDDKDTDKVLKKIKSLLKDDGLVLISTTKHEQMSSGFLQKSNFQNKAIRYRTQYSQEGLTRVLEKNGFKVVSVDIANDNEVNGKTWMNFILKKI